MRRRRFSVALAVAVASLGLLSAGGASARSCRSAGSAFALHVAGAPCSAGRSVQRGYWTQADFGRQGYVIHARGTTWRCRWRILKYGKQQEFYREVTGQITCTNRRKSALVLWKYRGGGV